MPKQRVAVRVGQPSDVVAVQVTDRDYPDVVEAEPEATQLAGKLAAD